MQSLPRKIRETAAIATDLLTMVIIEESHREWQSPTILMPKLDVSTQFCMGFEKVNES